MSAVRVNYATGQFGKTVAARLVYGTDLLEGIEQLCAENNIEYATIISCFGSFQRSGFVYLVPNEASVIGVGYNDLVRKDGPIEFLQGTGVVCKREGVYETHFHGTMCDQKGNVFGGHFIKGENPVITVDLVIAEVAGMEFHRQFDPETGGNQFYPVEKNDTEPRRIEK